MIADDTESDNVSISSEDSINHGHDLEGTEAAVTQGKRGAFRFPQNKSKQL